ncbi:hypothetical protein Sjap_015160 [Stephania japonica]|uniref:Uncharacterized protein n=1 Tax=Stephania japonica TaxID=461633 RepID=A0AAP0NR44_9MAGN
MSEADSLSHVSQVSSANRRAPRCLSSSASANPRVPHHQSSSASANPQLPRHLPQPSPLSSCSIGLRMRAGAVSQIFGDLRELLSRPSSRHVSRSQPLTTRQRLHSQLIACCHVTRYNTLGQSACDTSATQEIHPMTA